jgi:hypothetical protein
LKQNKKRKEHFFKKYRRKTPHINHCEICQTSPGLGRTALQQASGRSPGRSPCAGSPAGGRLAEEVARTVVRRGTCLHRCSHAGAPQRQPLTGELTRAGAPSGGRLAGRSLGPSIVGKLACPGAPGGGSRADAPRRRPPRWELARARAPIGPALRLVGEYNFCIFDPFQQFFLHLDPVQKNQKMDPSTWPKDMTPLYNSTTP